ncbi:MAG: CYTH domain-containing protein [Firmicutes bacterium]|nr:CYTH domain-containing protein [Bacillota bacterium]
METEFKYRINDASVFDSIIKDPILENHLKNDKVDEVQMHAVYFDTEDQDLRNAGIAYRIRYENDRIVATIKWDVEVNEEDGLHVREEIDLVINDERFAEAPDIDIFKSSDAYEVLYEAVGDKKLIKTIEMDFCRKLVMVDTGKSISALSLDEGVIGNKKGAVDVLELEIEWYHGDENDFKDLAHRIAEKYQLEPEQESKLQRAFAE